MSLDRELKDLKRKKTELEADLSKVNAAIAALGGLAVVGGRKSVTKTLKNGFQRSESWRRKISIAAKKRWAAVKAAKLKSKKV